MSIEEIITTSHLNVEILDAEENPGLLGGWPEGTRHFVAHLRNARGALDVHYSQGPGIAGTPSGADILGAVASDLASIAGVSDWPEWAEELGLLEELNAEAIRAVEGAYSRIVSQGCALEVILGAERFAALLEADTGS